MRAAKNFTRQLSNQQLLQITERILVDLYGSLALTGKGHGTDKAIVNGLAGYEPETVDPTSINPRFTEIVSSNQLKLTDQKIITFIYQRDLLLHQKEILPCHTNGMRFSAFD